MLSSCGPPIEQFSFRGRRRIISVGRFARCSVDFHWGWNFSPQSPPRPSLSWEQDEGVFISHSFASRHISHFAESVNQLLVKFRNVSSMPAFKTLYLSNYDPRSEFEWSNTYLRLLLRLFPPSQRPNVHYYSFYGHCYKSAVSIFCLSIKDID